jgi:P-type E1-E2 ATPase
VLSGIIHLVQQAQASRAPVQKLVDTISSYFVPLVIVLSFITLTVWFFWGPPPQVGHAIVSMILVLIIACPCALGLATPLSVVIGIGQGALQGVLIKNAQAIEQIGKITAIVFDKTGTLTKGNLEIEQFQAVSDSDAI